ncbi:DUF1501 domain-containing protein [bacterium]|nr:DUF1501 domain-containing protein [bacterium]
MLRFTGRGSVTTCDGMTRRDFLEVGSLSALGLTMLDWASAKARGAVRGPDDRAAIMIFNLGAPSQLDTWDMKPEAPAEIRGPFRPIATNVPGIQISEILPRLAQHMDKISLVRSCFHTGAAVHDTGHQMLQTGRAFQGGIITPHIGCVAGYLKGRKGDLPPHVLLPEPMGPTGGNMPHGQEAGFLGKANDPYALMADPSKPNFQVPDLLPPADLGEVRLKRRQRLRQMVDAKVKDFEASEDAKLLDSNFESAFRLMTSPQAREAFDLAREPSTVRDRYGMNRFGQCCLLARRLVEAGVRFVTVNTFITVFNEITWDIHGSVPFTSIQGMRELVAPMYDQAVSALLEDLHQRGLLDSTMVCQLAEFGRTPKVNPAGGRDHWPQCWTSLFSGGGVQGGRVVGKSDEIGGYPAERPVEPGEIIATICKSMGIDIETKLPGPQSRPFPVVDYGIRPIEELF